MSNSESLLYTGLEALTLVSSAQTPTSLEKLFQPLIAGILGFDPVNDSTRAFNAVRIGWQQEGQPAWGINSDVCIIRTTLENDPLARVRDEFYAEDANSSSEDLIKQMGFTQVWNLHLCLYGPNSADHARLILSAITLDWVNEFLATSSIYRVVMTKRPEYVPENYMGQWWKRTDVELQFNEQVNESLTPVLSAVGVDVTIVTDMGQTEEITIGTVV